jgi:carbamoyltransferase
MANAYLGPNFDGDRVTQSIESNPFYDSLSVHHFDNEAELVNAAATDLSKGKAVAWFQGCMEFGPRALGARSILANPMLETTQRDLNLKVKFRESFRPFAPIVKAESASDWFQIDRESPYMLLVAPVAERHRLPVDESKKGLSKLYQKRSTIPAVTHVDYSARLQTISKEQNDRIHAVLSAFEALTGCPVLVNTSLNVRGEPIVCTPEDAMRCFCGTNIEVLYIENYRVEKTGDVKVLDSKFSNQFDED